MKKRSPGLVFLFSLSTLSLYGLFWAGHAKNDLQIDNVDKPRLWTVTLPTVLLLLLIPVDIFLRIYFIARPGFLQTEVYAAAAALIGLSSILCMLKQAKLNQQVAGFMHGTVPIQVASAPIAVAPMADPASIAPTMPVAPLTPTVTPTQAGDSWQQGLATIQPQIVAPESQTAARAALQTSAANQPAVQGPAPTPTIIKPHQ